MKKPLPGAGAFFMLKTIIMINFQTLFKDHWRFKRNVTGLFPHPLDFEGDAQFIQKDEYRLYEESGAYTLNDQSIDFATSYLYQLMSPIHCRILFPDQRPFYDLTESQQSLDHLCDPDHYRGHFKSLSPDFWELYWHISGPRKKNVEIMTCYFRV